MVNRSKFGKENGDKAQAEQKGLLYIYDYPLHLRNGNHRPKI